MAHDSSISYNCDEGSHERCRACDCSCHTQRARRTNTGRHGDDTVQGDQYNPLCSASAIRGGWRPEHREA